MGTDIINIDGVEIHPLKIFRDDRGEVRHMLRSNDEHFKGFGEIYFSTCNPLVVKAWHNHTIMTLGYACIAGSVEIGLVDMRPGPNQRNMMRVNLADQGEDYKLLIIPPGVWNGYKAICRGGHYGPAMIANCSTHPHTQNEIERYPADFFDKFEWGPRVHSG